MKSLFALTENIFCSLRFFYMVLEHIYKNVYILYKYFNLLKEMNKKMNASTGGSLDFCSVCRESFYNLNYI